MPAGFGVPMQAHDDAGPGTFMSQYERDPGAETPDIGARGAPGRQHMTAKRKQEAALRVLHGEPLETVRKRRLDSTSISA